MSTKYLARTAIEGGRANGWERWFSHKEERANTRAFVAKAANDVEYAEGRNPKQRKKVYKDFKDKLSAVRRWLDSNCGRPWVDVKHDVHAMFDDRTTAGRHIMYCHMLNDVQDWPEDQKNWYSARDYIVDADGFLQKRPRKCWPKSQKSAVPEAELIAWANGRLVRVIGSKLFWCVRPVKVTGYHWCAEFKREVKIAMCYCTHCKNFVDGYRQDKELDINDAKFFRSLTFREQNRVSFDK